MKLAAILAFATLATTLPAQEIPNDERSELRQAALLENSLLILERVRAIESRMGGDGGSGVLPPDLAERLRILEERQAGAPAPAVAPDADTTDNLNTLWITIAAVLVFFMQAGFCLLELGFTRSKNAINVCMKNFLDFSTGAICFLFIGFAIMFGATVGGWFGAGPFWLSGMPGDDAFWAFWLFQTMFAGTSATILSGAMAERTKFLGYVVFTIAMTSVIYPVIGHWAWGSLAGDFGYGGGEGWLEKMGYVDFAGSSVVHGIGGAAALAGVLVLGPRVGRFRRDGSANLLSGHNLPLAALGTLILWFGWYGFNAGSTLVADASIGRIAANTTLAPAAGALAAMFAIWITQGRPDLGMTLNGALGGLVGITANCHLVSPASAVVIGIIAGVITTLASQLLERLRIDDAVGAVPVHLFCGWWGILAVAFFDEAGFDPARLGVQALGVAAITGSAFVLSYAAFVLVDRTIGLRATDDEQDLGLDFSEHSATAYPDFLTGDQTLSLSEEIKK